MYRRSISDAQPSTSAVPNRRGHSLAEILISLTLLSATIAGVALFAPFAAKARTSVVSAAAARRCVANYREEIATWQFDEITKASIESNDPRTTKLSGLENLQWRAEVEAVKLPTVEEGATSQIDSAVKRVELSLVGVAEGGTEAEPARLVFWVLGGADEDREDDR